MNLERHLRVLWNHKLVVAGGLILGFVLAFLAAYNVSSGGLERRGGEVWSSTSQIMVTQQGFRNYIQHGLDSRILAVRGQSEESEENIGRRRARLFQDRLDALVQDDVEFLDTDLDVIAGAALISGDFSTRAVNQHEGRLRAATVDAQKISVSLFHVSCRPPPVFSPARESVRPERRG